jgi:hypothetical protein
MTIALDLGAFAMRSLRRRGNGLLAHRCRSVALSLADHAARRDYLQTSKASFLVADNFLVLPGDAAIDAAAFFELAPRDLFPNGEVPTADPVARQVISAVVDALLPWSAGPEEICCFTQPGRFHLPSGGDLAMDYRLQFVARLIRLRGYKPLPLHPATALILSELGNAGFTGIGLALGASACDMAVVHRGVQIASERVGRGGGWIDLELARATMTWRHDALGERVFDLENARKRKETATLAAPANADDRIVADLYMKLIAELVNAMSDLLDSDAQIPLLPQPLPFVCGGGPSQIAGFREMLTGKLRGRDFPVAFSSPRLVSDHNYAFSRGCLIRAELEQAAAPADGTSPKRRRGGRAQSASPMTGVAIYNPSACL